MEKTENELTGWLSTYGLITAQRILGYYQINLPHEDLVCALKSPQSFYHQLLDLPLRHVFNGIILKQVQDYQLYAQKLIIDYLLSGEPIKDEESPGTLGRENLENERLLLVNLNQNLRDLELEHEKLISLSQNFLIKHAKAFHRQITALAKPLKREMPDLGIQDEETLVKAMVTLLCNFNFKTMTLSHEKQWEHAEKVLSIKLNTQQRSIIIEKLKTLGEFTLDNALELVNFNEETTIINSRIRTFRNDFYELILRAKEIISILPEYRLNLDQENENKSSLLFDPKLGEDTA